MITKGTVFVVGAGASCVYGLPTGAGLLQAARKLQEKDDTYQLICLGSDARKLNSIIGDLKEHGAESIDAYLQTRRKDEKTQTIGKRIIAVLLAEALTKLKQPKGEDWLKYIFNRMFDGAEDDFEQFKQNRVTFVTFNFDTCIEDRFNTFLRSTYDSEAYGFPAVIHVHGSLTVPCLPKVAPGMPTVQFPPRDRFGDFGEDLNRWAETAASNIRVIFEEIDPGVVQAAQDAVSAASVVWFLGFGYGARNLNRVGVRDKFMRTNGPSLTVLGSAFDLQVGEQESIQQHFPEQQSGQRIKLAGPGLSCLSALRELGGI